MQLNYLDRAYEINKIEEHLSKTKFFALQSMFDDNKSNQEIIDIALEIMLDLIDHNDLDYLY